MQKLPLQPPYYDMAPSESTPFTDKPVSTDAADLRAPLHKEVIVGFEQLKFPVNG